MFRSLLIANRGEIAVRILRTARALGLRTVAVHSDADAGALHVALADEAVRVGPAPARESYLNGEAILAAARATGAEAIHPGYGFLSENADFAEACAAAGVAFVGPTPEAIRIMGAKDAARRRMQEAGVPVVPGLDGEPVATAPDAAAAEVGFPLLVKAAAGGGGKGMRVVRDPEALHDAIAGVRREALAAFGDDRLILERWVENARHVEVQVFADAHGNCIHLLDRDCSVQRRNQKVIEEAPAPDVSEDVREAMTAAAVRAAQTVGYRGAGTVEFLLAGEEFFFLEMNTRLQVEHPVTEMITGIDLVSWQLVVAAGEPLPQRQSEVVSAGHAVEARLYAEDPDVGFLPSIGRLDLFRAPAGSPDVRVDTGVRQGDVVSPHYDPMLAKMIAVGPDRSAAFARLDRALSEVRLHGVKSNLDLLRALVRDVELGAGPVPTTWLEQRLEALTRAPAPEEMHWAAAALATAEYRARRCADDRFGVMRGFRLNAAAVERVVLMHGDARRECLVSRGAGALDVDTGEQVFELRHAAVSEAALEMTADDARHRFDVLFIEDPQAPAVVLVGGRGTHRFVLGDVLAPALERDEAVAGSLLAPMPGQVVAVHVSADDRVEAGDALMVLEAMKMEHTIRAPHAGRVVRVDYASGDRVEEGVVLVEIEEGE